MTTGRNESVESSAGSLNNQIAGTANRGSDVPQSGGSFQMKSGSFSGWDLLIGPGSTARNASPECLIFAWSTASEF